MATRIPIDHPVAQSVGRLVNRTLRPRGLEIRPLREAGHDDPVAIPGVPDGTGTTGARTSGQGIQSLSTDLLHTDEELRALFAQRAGPILERHRQQSREAVLYLREQYREPIFGKVRVWDLVERLGGCVDPTDQRLFGASQQLHIRQMLDAMEADGVATSEWVLVALIHDLGKLLLLTKEDPANVVCMNSPIGENDDGAGLDNSFIQWNHDEFAYERLKHLIPDELAWLIRYHSLEIGEARHLMDGRDLERTARLLEPFAHYDHATKTPFGLPVTPLERYRDIVEESFPNPILF